MFSDMLNLKFLSDVREIVLDVSEVLERGLGYCINESLYQWQTI